MAETQASAAFAGVTMEGGDLASLLQKEFKPKTDDAKSAVEKAVQTLAQQALSQTQADRQRCRQVDRGNDRRDRQEAV
jgi:type VI secretion system protein ImpC